MIHVVVIVTAHPGERDALLAAAQANMAAVRETYGGQPRDSRFGTGLRSGRKEAVLF